MPWWVGGGAIEIVFESALAPIFGVYAAIAVCRTLRRPLRAAVQLAVICAGAVVVGHLAALLVAYLLGGVPSAPKALQPLMRESVACGIALTVSMLVSQEWRRLAPAAAVATAIAWFLAWMATRFIQLPATSATVNQSFELILRALPGAQWHLVCGIGLALHLRAAKRSQRMSARVLCSACGYALTGLGDVERCPECGATFGARPKAGEGA